MGRPERPVDPDAGSLQRFAHDLRVLRREAGQPSYRELAKRAHYSDTTLSVAASGTVMPTLGATLALVRACGGDPLEWERRWRSLAVEVKGQPDADPTSTLGGPDAGPGPRDGPAAGRSQLHSHPAAGPAAAGTAATSGASSRNGTRSRDTTSPGPLRARWPWAAAGLAAVAAVSIAVGVITLGLGIGGSRAPERAAGAVTSLAGPGCGSQGGAGFTAHGAWQHHRSGPGGGLACDGEYMTSALASGAVPAPSVAEWDFGTGGASRCLLWIYLPKFDENAGMAIYNVFTAGQRQVAQFFVDQAGYQGLTLTEGPYHASQGTLRVRLENTTIDGFKGNIAAAAVEADCT